MKINIIDSCNYFKGLLLLISKTNSISIRETEMMKQVGKALGLEKGFCEVAVRDILENQYIEKTSPKFSSKQLAMKFLRDGLRLAHYENGIHSSEEEWLRSIANKNELDLQWFLAQKEMIEREKHTSLHLEVEEITVKYA